MKTKEKLIIVFIFQLMPGYSFSQFRNGFYIGYGFLHEVLAGYESPPGNATIGIEAAYVFPFTTENYYKPSGFDFWTTLARGANTQGIRIKPSLNLNFGTDKKQSISFTPELSFLKSGNFIIDDGKFSGSSSTYYAEFRETYQAFGIHITYGKHFGKKGLISFFAGPGLRFKNVTRNYSIEGYYSLQTPSDKTEDFSVTEFIITTGIRLYFSGFRKER